MICVGCGCTEERACVVDGVPCSWFSTEIPYCTACFDKAEGELVVGAKVRIRFGASKGKLGTVTQIPKLWPERRLVRRYGVTVPETFHASVLVLEKR